jgi:thymidine phosphorylase
VRAQAAGFVGSVATRDLGLAVIGLGGGRTRPQDAIDPSVGLTGLKRTGARIERDEPFATIHARDAASADRAEAALRDAYRTDAAAPIMAPAILDRIAG